ncbi:hypothetical protein GCM10007170_28410 [Arthrobacter liuii]|uniref:Uncharacterized protein n=1 Tax=Arthrobacter liuii TaxID=1476996 RepID=A0ABQ2AX68_9MICC|nr:hypothetical protein GCM10007170_28410 [Arthrobacter liuii]
MGLSSIMDNYIGVGDQAIYKSRVCNVSLNEGEAFLRKALQRLKVARIGQLVQNSDMVFRVFENVVDKV